MRHSRIIDFSNLSTADLELVGKRGFELSELKYLGIPVPDGFVITTDFFHEFFSKTGIISEINEIKKMNHPAIESSVSRLFLPIQEKILNTTIPDYLVMELHKAYRKLSGELRHSSLNIFSSSPNSYKTVEYKNIKGDTNFILKVKKILSSCFENPIAIVVQKNVDSKAKGKIFTNDLTGIKKSLVTQEHINQLINISEKIQKHFYFPKELKYAVLGNKIFITNIKPLTDVVSLPPRILPNNDKKRPILIKGIPLNPGIVTGTAKILNNYHHRMLIKREDIVILPKVNRSIYKEIKKAKGIVVSSILPTHYDKMVYKKEIKIPTVIGAKDAIKMIHNGKLITLNALSGEVYSGGLYE